MTGTASLGQGNDSTWWDDMEAGPIGPLIERIVEEDAGLTGNR